MVVTMSIDNILLKPNIEPFDSNTQRIRRNLLITSIVAFIFTVASSGIDPKSSILGVKFTELKSEYISFLILISLIYFLVHFLWTIYDHFKENSLRLTGLAIPIAKNTWILTDTSLEPNTTDYKQSTLNSWVAGEISNIENGKISFKELKEHEVKERLQYIELALEKFEQGFWSHQRSQLIRWCVLDCIIPITIAIAAISFMIGEVYCK
ncbi:MAG: hypothetical protein ACI9B7_000399 [Oleispira sp.]|jgi:hypothetical protein